MGMDVEEEDAFTRVDACTARRYTSLTLRNLRMPRFREEGIQLTPLEVLGTPTDVLLEVLRSGFRKAPLDVLFQSTSRRTIS